MSDDFTVTQRDIRVQKTRSGPLLSVIGYDYENRTPSWVPRKSLGDYAFKIIHDDMADRIRGDLPDTDERPVMYIGDNFGKNYWSSHDDTVPVDVLEWLEVNGFQLVTNVDGGWATWEGRPEWSEHYVDFSEAETVDMTEELAERRQVEQ